MLRTVGINAVLALSGAPVCAKEVRISPFSIGTADEILQGTNSRDRIEGAKAVVRKLTDAGGVGMVTTHDPELTRIVEKFDGKAANVHFVDQLVDGEIRFDYKMRDGVVETSNALALMRSMGLEV